MVQDTCSDSLHISVAVAELLKHNAENLSEKILFTGGFHLENTEEKN